MQDSATSSDTDTPDADADALHCANRALRRQLRHNRRRMRPRRLRRARRVTAPVQVIDLLSNAVSTPLLRNAASTADDQRDEAMPFDTPRFDFLFFSPFII